MTDKMYAALDRGKGAVLAAAISAVVIYGFGHFVHLALTR